MAKGDLTMSVIKDNTSLVKDSLEDAIERALEAVGLQAESYAKAKCPVDTGLLRNSITHALAGQPPAISTYSGGDGKGNALKKGKKAKSSKQPTTGSYTGAMPYEPHTVYIGTNVEYAPYVEAGHKLPGGGKVPGTWFLKSAVTGHSSTYKKLIEAALKGF